ncbi:hypothetical protein HC174_06245 [Salinimicrobium sp. CDJ15-81-2]|nr:hypothetical protein [Salinimicrobium nanhaiense]
MKKYIFLLLFIGVTKSGFAQYKPAVVVFKSGDSISGILGDIQRKAFKYKTQVNGKSEKVDFSEIDYVKVLYSGKDVRTFKFFKLDDDEKYTKLQQLSTGQNAELYSLSFYAQSSFGAGPSMSQEVVKYYVKRPGEENLTFMGIYDPIPNTLRGKVITYVSDCPELVEKILNREFRIRNGLAPIFEFYNRGCNSI